MANAVSPNGGREEAITSGAAERDHAEALGATGQIRIVQEVESAFTEVVTAVFANREQQRFSLVLSGGPTARRCYTDLAMTCLTAPRSSEGGAIDWSVVDIYFSDERCVDPEDPDSNYHQACDALLDKVGPVGSVHPMYVGGNPDKAAAAYEKLIAPLGSFDLVHLGLGPDGHTASLFEGSEALDNPRGALCMASSDPSGRNPHQRITLTLEALSRAREVVFTVTGTEKLPAFQRLRDGVDIPASRVRARSVLWLVDQAAATPGHP
ncbi:MAG: 6-phosphogluconolactonase [Acidimicrobiales bacterium]